MDVDRRKKLFILLALLIIGKLYVVTIITLDINQPPRNIVVYTKIEHGKQIFENIHVNLINKIKYNSFGGETLIGHSFDYGIWMGTSNSNWNRGDISRR